MLIVDKWTNRHVQSADGPFSDNFILLFLFGSMEKLTHVNISPFNGLKLGTVRRRSELERAFPSIYRLYYHCECSSLYDQSSQKSVTIHGIVRNYNEIFYDAQHDTKCKQETLNFQPDTAHLNEVREESVLDHCTTLFRVLQPTLYTKW